MYRKQTNLNFSFKYENIELEYELPESDLDPTTKNVLTA
jgi:hypothetical protein